MQQLIDDYCGGMADGTVIPAGRCFGNFAKATLNAIPLDFRASALWLFIRSAAVIVWATMTRRVMPP
jgi:NADH:ubiquinone oxidoreductase subunit F (NADH-binding)